MKEVVKKEKMAQEITQPDKKCKGYTIEEIRFKRALVAMEAEFCKTKINRSWSNIQEANPLSPGNKTTLPGKAGSLALKMVSGLNYLDYALLGFSIFKGARKIFSFFKRK